MKRVIFTVNDTADKRIWSGTPANIAAAMAADGWRIEAVSPEIKSLPLRALGVMDYLQGRLGFVGMASPTRVRVALEGDARSAYRRMTLHRRIAELLVSKRLAHRTKAPVLHFSTLHLPLTGAARTWPNLLVIDSTWALTAPLSEAEHQFSSTQLTQAAALERRALESIDHFLVIGEHVGHSLTRDYGIDPKRITAVGTGVGGIAAYDGPKDYANGRILFCAKHRLAEKGLFLLLDGFAKARERFPFLKLVLAGHASFPELASRHPGVEGHASVSWNKLQELFRDSALFAMPALHEPWGLVYLEALVSRMPVLGLDRLAMPELTGNGRYGFLVREPTGEAVAAALEDAWSDPVRLEQMGWDGQQAVRQRYGWDKVATRIGDAIERLQTEKGLR